MPTVPENEVEDAYGDRGPPYSLKRAGSILGGAASSMFGEARKLFTTPGRALKGEATPEEIEMFGPQVAPYLVGGGLGATKFLSAAEREIASTAKAVREGNIAYLPEKKMLEHFEQKAKISDPWTGVPSEEISKAIESGYTPKMWKEHKDMVAAVDEAMKMSGKAASANPAEVKEAIEWLKTKNKAEFEKNMPNYKDVDPGPWGPIEYKEYKKTIGDIASDAASSFYTVAEHFTDKWKRENVKLEANPMTPAEWQALQHKYAPRSAIPESAEQAGFNPNYPIFKGGSSERLRRQLADPSKKGYERGSFFADDPDVAKSYGSVHEYVARPKSPAVIDMKGTGYSSSWMNQLIDNAKAKGHDLLVVRNLYDIGSAGKPQNQVVILDPSIVRSPRAAFDPNSFHIHDVLAGILATAGAAKVVKEIGNE